MPANLDFPMYFNIAFISVLLFGAIFGYIRGFKKALYVFIFTLLFISIFFFTLDIVINFIYNVNMPFLGGLLANVSPDLASVSTLKEAIPAFLAGQLGDDFQATLGNANFIEFVDSLALFVVKIVYALLYFTIIQILIRFILFIVRVIFFKQSKEKAKYKSKNRLMGALFGTLSGAISVFVTLIIFGGIINISESLTVVAGGVVPQSQTLEDTGARSNVYQATHNVIQLDTSPEMQQLEDAMDLLNDMIDAYNNNIIVQGASAITIVETEGDDPEQLNIFLFDEVMSIEYQEEQIAFREELGVFAQAAGVVLNSDFIETRDIASISGQDIRDVFTTLSESNLLTTIIPLGIEVASDMFETEITIPVDELYEIAWDEEIMQLGEIAATVFDIIDAANLLDSDTDFNTVTFDTDEIDLVRDLFDELGDSELINLAAYVAIEPVLEAAGTVVQSVITVPADINWGDEISAIGEIAATVLATGISIGDIQSGDVNLLLTNIASMNFTVILESRIVTQALINVLSGNSELDIDLSYLVIPSDLDWEMELENILLAFNALASQVADIDFENLDITSLVDLDVEAINTIFESRILVATITDLVRNLDLGDMTLIMPDSVFDENGYLLKLELQNIVSAVHMAANQLVCDPGNTECEELGFDITKALTLDGDDIDTLLESEILAATVGNLVLEMGGDVLTVPGSAKTAILVDGVNRDVVSEEEIKAAFLAISTLGITNIDDIEVDISILNNLALEDDPTALDPDKAETLFASLILNATLSSYLIDFADQVDAFIVVPYLDQDETPVRLSDPIDGTQSISRTELTNILEAILIIDLQDINNIETLDLGEILSNVNVLLESSILHATVSKQLLDLTDVVSVPMNDQLGNPLRITTGPVGNETEFIDKDELIAAFDALEILGITDINNVTIDVSILNNLGTDADPTILDTAKADTLFASSIINATLAKFLIDFSEQENAVLVVPELDQDGGTIRTTDSADGTEYIAQTELTNILEAILILDLQDFESIDTLSLDTLISNVGTLLESAILHATVSKQLLDLTDVVAVPMNNQAGDPLRITQGTVEFIDRDELELAFDALSVLGITDINNVAVDVSILNNLGTDADPTILDTDKSDTLFASSIITATISKFIIDFADGEDPFIVVPYEDENEVVVRIIDPVDGTQYISQEELTNILEAILILDLQDFDSVETLSLDIITDNSAVILDSVIMQASISKQLLDLGDVVTVPENDQLGNPIRIITSEGEVGKEVEIITEAELLAAFDALSVLGITDINNVAVDVSILNNLGTDADPTILDTTKSDTLFASSIITATISKYIIDFAELEDPFIVVPYEDELGVEVRITDPADGTEYVSQAELTNILEAILILDLQDFDSVETLDLDTIIANANVIVGSVIMQASISKQLLDLGDVVTVPENDQLGNPLRIMTSAGDVEKETEIIAEAELLATFDALSVLGITDINNISVDITILNNLGTDADPTILDQAKADDLFASSIITATLSSYIIDFTEEDEPFIVVPVSDELNVTVRTVDPADGTEYISEAELTNLLEAILILDLQDFNTVETLPLDTIISNADVIVGSVIMQASISKQLIDLGDVVTVPLNDQFGNPLRITRGTDEFIVKQELLATFDALNVLGIEDINDVAIDVSILNNLGTEADSTILDQDKADDLFASSIITATLSGYIIDFTSEDDPFIVVPAQTQEGTVIRSLDLADNTEYISQTELTDLLEAILILNLQDFNTVETLSLDVLIANNAVILGSSIMQASISKQFIDLGSDIILVPEYFENDSLLRIDIAGTEYIDRDELSATFESLGVLGIDSINNVSVDISILKNLATEEDTTLLDDTKATTLFASTIIKATVSSYILDFGTGDSPLLTIPYKSENDSVIINDDTLDSTEFIVELELKNILKAILALDLTSFNEVDTLDLDVIMDNKTVILDSSILQATISQQIFDLGSDIIQVPYYEENDITLVRITVGEVGKETEFIARLELDALLDSLNVLGIDDINSFGGDIGFGEIISDSAKVDTLLASSIIQATITEQIVSLVDGEDDPLLIVPYESELSADVRLVVGGVGQETEYITVVELKFLFDALNILGMGNIDEFGGTIDLTRLDTPEKITTLVSSSIIQATISKQVFDMAGDNTAQTAVIVPYKTDLGDISLRIIVGDEIGIENEIIIKSEIVDLIEAFLALGYGDVNDLSSTISLSDLADNADTVFDSYIIQATVSKQVIDLDIADTILVPYLEDNNTTRIRNLVNPGPNQTEYITKSELEALVLALDVLNVTNVEGFDGVIDISLFYDQASRNTLLASSILQATITDQIIAVGNAIAVPYLSDDEGEIVRFDVGLLTEVTEYIAKDEIHALFEALEILGMDAIDDLSGPILLTALFASSNPGTYDDNQNTLLASRIMQATISDQINDLSGSLRIPTEDIDNVTVKTTTSEGDFYIYTAEIKHLINALDILGEDDITEFSGNVSLTALFPSTNVNAATNQTTLLASAIIHATMTDQIFALDGDELTIPGQDFSEDDIKVYTLVASDFYIAKLEIKSLLNALDVIGFNQGDISDFDGAINIAVLGTENNQNTVLTSAIMHATISKQIFDLSDDVLIVPLYTQAGETLGNEVQKSVGVVDYIYTAEIKAIMNAFIDMGFTDLGTSIGSSISSDTFFDNPNLYLQSSSIQATLSKKLFDINASETIIIYPEQDIRPITPITIILEHADVTYIEVNELKALLAAMDEMGLTNFSSVSITPSIILGKDYNIITDSAIMQATVSEKVLSGATDELSPVNGKLIVPNYFREAITVDSVASEWIEQNELISLFGALEVLNITDFSGSVSASAVTNMSSTDLDTMLESGSMHVTIDNMLKNNNNINSDIPDYTEGLALTDLLYNMSNVIVKAEVKAFIIATQQFAGADLSSVSFDVAAITSLTPAERDIVLDSMIVRNILTDELETMMTNDDPFDLYWPANSDYEQNNPAYFLTEAGINAVLTHYGLI